MWALSSAYKLCHNLKPKAHGNCAFPFWYFSGVIGHAYCSFYLVYIACTQLSLAWGRRKPTSIVLCTVHTSSRWCASSSRRASQLQMMASEAETYVNGAQWTQQYLLLPSVIGFSEGCHHLGLQTLPVLCPCSRTLTGLGCQSMALDDGNSCWNQVPNEIGWTFWEICDCQSQVPAIRNLIWSCEALLPRTHTFCKCEHGAHASVWWQPRPKLAGM